MDNAFFVGGGEAPGDLLAVFVGLAQREGAGTHPVAQGFAFEALGDEVRRAFVFPEVVHGKDVGMAECGDGLASC